MDTVFTIIAGLVLAAAASAGLVVSQGGGPSGTAPTPPADVVAVYGS
jgi:hypothetical protein